MLQKVAMESNQVPTLTPTVILFMTLNDLLDVSESFSSSLQRTTPTIKVALTITQEYVVQDQTRNRC